QCVEELKASTPPAATREAWEARTRPFRDLWLLLNEPDALSDSQAEETLGRLEQDFGRGLMSAITLRRLVTLSEVASGLGGRGDGRGDQPTPVSPPVVDEAPKPVALLEVAPKEPQAPTAREAAPSTASIADQRPGVPPQRI